MRLLIAVYIIIVFSSPILTGCGYEIRKKNEHTTEEIIPQKSIAEKETQNETDKVSEFSKTNDQVIQDFDYLMDWYHPYTNYDKAVTKTIFIGDNKYSIKYLKKWRLLEGCISDSEGKCEWCNGSGKDLEGYTCNLCDGDGSIDWVDYEQYANATISYDPLTNQVSIAGVYP